MTERDSAESASAWWDRLAQKDLAVWLRSSAPERRTAACPPLPMLRAALLREDWSPIDRAHAESCGYCQRNLRQIAAQAAHPTVSRLYRQLRHRLAEDDAAETTFHLEQDGCRRCQQIAALLASDAHLAMLAERAVLIEDTVEAEPTVIARAWTRFAEAALRRPELIASVRTALEALRNASSVAPPVAASPPELAAAPAAPPGEIAKPARAPEVREEPFAPAPGLVRKVENWLAGLRRGERGARTALMELVWEKLTAHIERRWPAAPWDESAAWGRLQQTLERAGPRTAGEFYQTATAYLRSEMAEVARSARRLEPSWAEACPAADAPDPRRLELAIEALSPEDRQLVELLAARNLTIDEAAHQLEVAPSTVARRWARIREDLRKALEGIELR